jgi:tetratricopeptide (TPR) repeat protein
VDQKNFGNSKGYQVNAQSIGQLGDRYESYAQKEVAVLGLGAHPPNFEDYWVERQAYQTTLTDRLARESVVEIMAAGGFGKSSLAAWAYQNLTGEFQRFWIDFRNGWTFNAVARWLLQEIGFLVRDPAATDEALLRELLYRLRALKQPLLLVLDQLEQIADAPDRPWFEQFLTGWAQDGKGSRVLMTTRSPLLAQEPIVLKGLTEAEGTEFLQREGIAGDLGAVVAVAGGHPLLLKLAATWAKQTYGGRLDGAAIDFFGKLFGQYQGDPRAGVESIFGVIFADLPEGWQELLLRVSVYRLPFDLAMAKVMQGSFFDVQNELAVSLDLDLSSVLASITQQSVQELSARGLMLAQGDRFTLHPLVKELVQARVPEQIREQAHERAIVYYSANFQPWNGTIESCQAELEGIYHACELGQYELAYGLLARCVNQLDRAGYWRELQKPYEQLTTAWKPEDAAATQKLGWAWTRLGDLQRQLGNVALSIDSHHQAQAIFDRLDFPEGKAAALCHLGSAHYSIGDYQRSIEFHSQHRELAQEIGDKRGVAASFGNLGLAYHSLGDCQRSIEFHSQSLEMTQESDDKLGIAASLCNLGNAYDSLGDYQRSIEFHSQSLEMAQEIGDKLGVAASLSGLGNAYYSLGDYQRSIEFHSQSLEMAQEIGDKRGVANSLSGLGITYGSLGDYQRSIEFHSQSLEIEQEIGNKGGVAASLGNLGIAYRSLGNYQRAIDFHSQSLEIEQEIGNKGGIATSLGNLGNAYYSLGDYQRAIDFHSQSLEIKQVIGDRNGEADSFFNLAQAQAKLADHWAAKQNLEQAKAIYTTLKLDHMVEKCDQALLTLTQQRRRKWLWKFVICFGLGLSLALLIAWLRR